MKTIRRMNDLQGKAAVVTGAGRGIGKAIARQFASAGAKVAVVSRSEGSCSGAADEINADFPDSCFSLALDVSSTSDCAAATDELVEKLGGGIDILVNNAGVTRDQLALRMSEEDWDVVLDTNLKGAFNMTKAVQRSLLRRPEAAIVNVSSVIGLIGNAGQANYAASKAGLIGFSKSLAREFAGRGVTVNVIAPGFITTDMTDALEDELKEKIRTQVPLGRLGEVADVANLAHFLVGPNARYLTGQVIAVDGGMAM